MRQAIVVLALGAAAFFGYRYVDALPPKFSVSASRQLGDADAIDSWFAKQGVGATKSDGKLVADLFGERFSSSGDAKVTLYGTPADGAVVVQSAHGQLLAVGCRFASEDPTYSLGRSKIQRFACHYWNAVAETTPTFSPTNAQYSCNQWKGRIDCVWVKDGTNGPVKTTDTVTFVLGRAMIRPTTSR